MLENLNCLKQPVLSDCAGKALLFSPHVSINTQPVCTAVCLNAQAPVVIVGQEFVDSMGVCHGRWGFENSYKHAAIKHKWSCKHAVMKQNKRALTTHKAGERLSEKRQELIDFRQSLGVPGIALQHRPTSWHVESGRIHRVHLSSVVLDRSSSGRKKKKKRSDSTRLQSRQQPTYHQCRWTCACNSVACEMQGRFQQICLSLHRMH